ncbi:unnamed protein product [Polarella glacialis]|uniref:Uncharacterized protein n=1 Tax=Polarella glacialis TaxID=89957 RepID=A0A813FH41_POLGL|nr:unnamed protein product [Polarella glacialis]
MVPKSWTSPNQHDALQQQQQQKQQQQQQQKQQQQQQEQRREQKRGQEQEQKQQQQQQQQHNNNHNSSNNNNNQNNKNTHTITIASRKGPAPLSQLDLTWVAQCHHQGAGQAQPPTQVHSLRLRQLHHQDQLDQQQRHGQQPVHVAVAVASTGSHLGSPVPPSRRWPSPASNSSSQSPPAAASSPGSTRSAAEARSAASPRSGSRRVNWISPG